MWFEFELPDPRDTLSDDDETECSWVHFTSSIIDPRDRVNEVLNFSFSSWSSRDE